eukprot:CAMPEP_0116838746 /NCGR_PEP_ID=MMETSP0418-20121206/9383_1 /TAXON_ID=1158023 /ORGANISM="Astrosyne radiata, Strain 13vi08-1A" /LENGTH=193 /DNA_ID=CAMNT_0004468781 /DNA_START=307 /DNA_END=888 /DNA_ORIENTATION=-
MHLPRYVKSPSRVEKSTIIATIVDIVRGTGAVGFVKQDAETGAWFDVGDHAAREKVGQTIRDILKQRDPKRRAKKNLLRRQQARLQKSSARASTPTTTVGFAPVSPSSSLPSNIPEIQSFLPASDGGLSLDLPLTSKENSEWFSQPQHPLLARDPASTRVVETKRTSMVYPESDDQLLLTKKLLSSPISELWL